MKAWRVYHVLDNRSLEYRCTVLAGAAVGAELRGRQHPSVDGRRRLAVIEEGAYSEFPPSNRRADA